MVRAFVGCAVADIHSEDFGSWALRLCGWTAFFTSLGVGSRFEVVSRPAMTPALLVLFVGFTMLNVLPYAMAITSLTARSRCMSPVPIFTLVAVASGVLVNIGYVTQIYNRSFFTITEVLLQGLSQCLVPVLFLMIAEESRTSLHRLRAVIVILLGSLTILASLRLISLPFVRTANALVDNRAFFPIFLISALWALRTVLTRWNARLSLGAPPQ